MTQLQHNEPPGSYNSGLRTGWRLGGGLLLLLAAYFGLLGTLGHFAPQLRDWARGPAALRERAEPMYSVAATSITPITALNAGTTGALLVSADRIDLWARTSSSTATLNLVEYLPEETRWAKVGADCGVTTDLTLCRYVAKRGTRYWHVYKASGTMAYVGVEALTLPAGASLGSIEPQPASGVTSLTAGTGISITGTTTPTIALSTPVSTANGGTGLDSYTANCVFYSSSTSAIGQRCCSDGQYIKWASGVPTCTTAPTTATSDVFYAVFDNGQITSSAKAPSGSQTSSLGGGGAAWTTTNASAARFPVDGSYTYTVEVWLGGVVGSGNTLSIRLRCASAPGGSITISSATQIGTVAVGASSGSTTFQPSTGECIVVLITASTLLGQAGYVRVTR